MRINRISNGQIIELSQLNTAELYRLHYEEEKYVAQQMMSLPPFSRERDECLQNGYSIIDKIKAQYGSISENTSIGNGACNRSVELVCDFLKKNNMNREIVLYEAGSGSGYSCEKFLQIPNIKYIGCDVVVRDGIKKLQREYGDRIQVKKQQLYRSLSELDDNSIDFFYADNVFEHLLPDEFPEIMHVLTKKLKPDALLFVFIPNKLIGPHDISGKFLKIGQKAEGFHFLEKSYSDVVKEYKEFNIFPEYLTIGTRNKIFAIKDSKGRLSRIKILLEPIVKILPGKVIKKIYGRLLCLDSYILKYKCNPY